MSSDGSAVPTRMPNQAVPLRSVQAKGRGNRSSWAMAREVSVTIRVQPLRAPMPETTAMAAMNFPAQALWGNIESKALTNGDPVLTSVWCGDQPHHRPPSRARRGGRSSAVPSSEARTDVARGVLHPLGGHRRRLDADEGEQRHAGGDADAAVEAAARGVERAEVGRARRRTSRRRRRTAGAGT